MILWSIIPEELMLNDVNSLPIYDEIEWHGMKCVVEKTNSDQYKVIRILTTNPSEYLRPELQPGTILTYAPVAKC